MIFVDIRLTLSEDSTGPLLTDTQILDTNATQEQRDRLADVWDFNETDAIIDVLVDPNTGEEQLDFRNQQG